MNHGDLEQPMANPWQAWVIAISTNQRRHSGDVNAFGK
jgi:hypothetical protein